MEGERHGGWTLSAYHDGKLVFRLEGPYVKDKKHGRWKVLASIATPKEHWEGSYARGERDGLWRYSWSNRSSGTYYYRKGKKYGPCTWEYRTRSSLESMTQTVRTAYVDDMLHGLYVYERNYRNWFSGRARGVDYNYKKGMYVKGKKHGKWLLKWRNTRWNRNINKEHYENYDNGRRIRVQPQNQEAATGDDDNTANED